ncbi:MAG: A/G-specific adenine glycosylase [Lachnospiraceae bacterium]|nr:A/G-specific adenine glycosylase [Lachnospiraceae bacterium]MDY5741550.1 A/G-specific adenine glycosylase [Lachnospiraceae bacterium]
MKDNRGRDWPEVLVEWYRENGRKLPWRGRGNAYYTWISEIMLQQTRVEAVKRYFTRFILELPDIAALAACREERLLKLWEGLGYYSRVRNLQKAARLIMEEHQGELPHSVRELLALPGIGDYTAGAIASIAYDQPAPAVDGNVLRVTARLLADDTNILLPQMKKRITAYMQGLMPENGSGDLNQALMDLGALVCLPGKPNCQSCPLTEFCEARRSGRAEELPVREKDTSKKVEEKTILVIQSGDRYLIYKRPVRGLLAGLYGLPELAGHKDERAVKAALEKEGLLPLAIWPLPAAKHVFTHRVWQMIGFFVKMEIETDFPGSQSGLWVTKEELAAHYPIPEAYRAYRQWLEAPEQIQKGGILL